jgi:hypothetical protein
VRRHAARMTKIRNGKKILTGKPELKDEFRDIIVHENIMPKCIFK